MGERLRSRLDSYYHAVHHRSRPDASARGANSMTDTYTCPMHPEVKSDKPGSCPKCGMALEKKSK
jgi:hypothetical protein